MAQQWKFNIICQCEKNEIKLENVVLSTFTFDKLKADIITKFLELKQIELSDIEICWNDGNGYEYAVCNDEDCAKYFKKYDAKEGEAADMDPPLLLTVHPKNSKKPYVHAETESVFIVHNDSNCDECKVEPIVGTLYKCLQCFDFELCEDCVSKSIHAEHKLQSMVRLDAATGCLVNVGVKCSGCDAEPILGTYFKSTERVDYNLCEACMPSNENSDEKMERFPQYAKAVDLPIKTDRTCSECSKDIVGFRYEATSDSLPEYNLCHVCFTSEKYTEHELVRVPKNCSAFPITVHEQVACRECGIAPIFGTQYKCLQCLEYIMCSNCAMRGKHGLHLIVRMPNALKLDKDFRNKEELSRSVLKTCESLSENKVSLLESMSYRKPEMVVSLANASTDAIRAVLKSHDESKLTPSDSFTVVNKTNAEEANAKGESLKKDKDGFPSLKAGGNTKSIDMKIFIQQLMDCRRNDIKALEKFNRDITKIIREHSADNPTGYDHFKVLEKNCSSLNHCNISDEKKLEIHSKVENKDPDDVKEDWHVVGSGTISASGPISIEQKISDSLQLLSDMGFLSENLTEVVKASNGDLNTVIDCLQSLTEENEKSVDSSKENNQ